MSQDLSALSARRDELLFMLGDASKALREAESNLALALESYLSKDISIKEWEEARRDRLQTSLPPIYSSLTQKEFIEGMIRRERPEFQAELEANLDRWIQSARERVLELRAIASMPAEERENLQREFDDIEARLPTSQTSQHSDEERSLSARRERLMYMLHGNVAEDLKRAERELQFALKASNIQAFMLDPSQPAPSEWIQSARDRVLELRAIVNMSPEDRAALQQELDKIEVQLNPYPLTEEDMRRLERREELFHLIDDSVSEVDEANYRLELAQIERTFGDDLDMAEKTYALQLGADQGLEEDESEQHDDTKPESPHYLTDEGRRVLEDSYSPHDEAQPVWQPSTDEERRLADRRVELMYALHGDVESDLRRAGVELQALVVSDPRSEVTQAARDEVYRLQSLTLMSPEERAALQQELDEIEVRLGIRPAPAPDSDPVTPPYEAAPQKPMTDEERRLSDRRVELMYALHGQVEDDLRRARVEYGALRDTAPESAATQAALREMQRLEGIMSMSPEERAALQQELEGIEVQLGMREPSPVVPSDVPAPDFSASSEQRLQRSQAVQEKFVASLAETMRNLAKQGSNPDLMDLAAQNLPYSAISGQEFSGANATLLMLKAEEKGYTDNRWMTFRQIESYRQDHPDVRIRAGEKGTTVLLPQHVSFIEQNGQREILSAEQVLELEIQRNKGKSVPEVKSGYLFAPYTVFNAEQIEGFPPKEVQAPGLSSQEKRELVDRFVAATGIKMDYTSQPTDSRWDEKTNRLIMPVPHLFQRMGSFITQKLRETFHALGHTSRENSPFYASGSLKERGLAEMRAEMFALMAGRYLGMGQDVPSMAGKVELWNRTFTGGDAQSLFRAAMDAGKMVTLLHEFAAGETPAAKWFPAKDTWEQSFYQAESNELKAALDWVGEALNGGWSDAPLNSELGTAIRTAIQGDVTLEQLQNYMIEAWPYLANSPSLPVINMANSYAKYLPDGVLERERELVAATISGARRMEAHSSPQVAAPLIQDGDKPAEDKRQTLTEFDGHDDLITRVRMLLHDPALLEKAIQQDPQGSRELAELCDLVSYTLHMELDAAAQAQAQDATPSKSDATRVRM